MSHRLGPPESDIQPATESSDTAVLQRTIEDLRRELAVRTRQLQQSSTRFRDVIERNADAILVVDHEGTIRFANGNAVALFGKNERLIGTPFGFPLVAEETTEIDLAGTTPPIVVEMRVVESEWDGSPALIASLRDITARKRAEEDARKLAREQAARAAAETGLQRFRVLAEAGVAFTSSLDPSAVLSGIARICATSVADWAVVYYVESDGHLRRAHVCHRDPALQPVARELERLPLDGGGRNPVEQLIRTREPVLVRDVAEESLAAMTRDPRHAELVRRLGIRSFMLVPLIARDRVLGAVALVSSDPARPFDQEDMAFAEELAARAALSIDNARLYHAAREANQTKADFLAVLSHDLRTPLTAIIGFAELLELGIPAPLPKESIRGVERIRSAARHLLYLINELLAFARLDAGHEEVRPAAVDLRALAGDVSSILEPLARQKNLAFAAALPAEPVMLRTDGDKVRQILLNLLGNAVKYTHAGEVRLRLAEVPDGTVRFTVSDTGIGIAPEHRDHIFEPFWQVDRSQRAKGAGTGLGLSVVRRLVTLLGGTIELESAIGRGSEFTVTLRQAAPV